MPRWLSLLQCLLRLAVPTALLLPVVARAQAPARFRTIWYDSARTQRRAVYGVQLRGSRPDTVAHGPFRRFARAGHLEELGHFTDGQADSIWTRYYASAPGQLPAVARRLPMRAGQPDGPFVVFYPDGRVAQRGTFRRGQLVDSLVSTGQTGRPRLLAQFDSSRGPGLRGTFRQWGGAYTARHLQGNWLEEQAVLVSDSSHYPTRDPARHWTGQLAAGRLVGAYTERDAAGEPLLRISYSPQGAWQLTTLYYPAAWLRDELKFNRQLPPDSIVHSLPLYQWQAVGPRPYLMQRYWEYQFGLDFGLPQTQVFRIVPAGRRHTFNGDVVGARNRPTGRAGTSATVTEVRPCPPVYRQSVALQLVRHPARWVVGAADTTEAYYFRPLLRGETALPDGRRLVQRPFVTRIYFPGGQLQEATRIRSFGRRLVRRYGPTGQHESMSRIGWLASYKRYWLPSPSRSYGTFSRLLGLRMVRVRHPLFHIGKLEINIGFLPSFRKPLPPHFR